MQELHLFFVFQYEVIVLQATIGIDFLSKTMYLEDRTVSPARPPLIFSITTRSLPEGTNTHIVPLATIHFTFTIPPSFISTSL